MFVLFVFMQMGGLGVARAQYMFLDADGDGEYSGFRENFSYLFGNGIVDVYLVTNRDRFGLPVTCGSGVEPGLRGYTLNLYSIDSPFSVISVSNQMPGMVETVPPVTHPYALTVGYSGATTFPPGKYLLMRLTLKVLPTTLSAGCGSLIFVPSNCYSPPGVETGFQSDCPGEQGDGFLRYGLDWVGTGDLGGCTDNTGRTPVVSCPGSVTAREGQALSFRGTVADPDCSVYGWYYYEPLPPGATASRSPFVNGESSFTVTWTPARGQAGTWPVTFEAYDPDPFNNRDRRSTCTTQVTILPEQIVHEARVFTTSSDRVTRVPHGKPSTCFQLEPIGASFALEDIVPSSLRLHYSSPGCGDHDLPAGGTRTTKIRDLDGNGLNELESCFRQEDLATLLPCLGPGTTVLPLEITASLVNGDLVRGLISHSFLSTGPQLASVSPNPLNAGSAVEFMTSRQGFAKVQIFDVHGRLLTTSMDEPSARPGYHRIPLGAGARLASGVYFIRVATEHDGAETRAVTIVR